MWRQGGILVSSCRRTWTSFTFVPTCCNRYRAWYGADRIETWFLVPALLLWLIFLSLGFWFLVGRIRVWQGISQSSHLALITQWQWVSASSLNLLPGNGYLCQWSPRQHKKNPYEFIQKKCTLHLVVTDNFRKVCSTCKDIFKYLGHSQQWSLANILYMKEEVVRNRVNINE